MKPYLIVLVIIFFFISGFWGGLKGEQIKSENAIATAVRHRELSDLRGCIFAVDSDTLHMLNTFDQDNIQRLSWRLTKCDEYLKSLGESKQTENTSRILGETRLFFDGYVESLNDVIERRVELENLYAADFSAEGRQKLQELEVEQTEQIDELQMFLERLETLIVRAW